MPHDRAAECIKALSQSGAFDRRVGNAVLIGTSAFQTYQSMLGIDIPAELAETDDVDMGASRKVRKKSDEMKINLSGALREVLQRVGAVTADRPEDRSPSAYRVDGDTKVEIVTPTKKDGYRHVLLTQFGTFAYPLAGLDFLLKDPVLATLLHGDGISVRVPRPERYALHKLMVSALRPTLAQRAKDEGQALVLIDGLAASPEGRAKLSAGWTELMKYPDDFVVTATIAGLEHVRQKTTIRAASPRDGALVQYPIIHGHSRHA